jgi:hypothetical protein
MIRWVAAAALVGLIAGGAAGWLAPTGALLDVNYM